MESFILLSKAISDPTRVRMLKLLEGGELCVCEIMEVLGLVQSTASKHLNILKIAGLVESRKGGTWSYYRLAERSREHNKDFMKFTALHLNDDDIITKDKKFLKTKRKNCCK
ncbi:MAG TPA: metalloregulator ArsR/SmtB family transcription factor [Thermodesulfovibrionales bacterium]|nr:metalloregulator ArsR/SmtB family transcription factor [Thermodesulfovibrionales bacterium]